MKKDGRRPFGLLLLSAAVSLLLLAGLSACESSGKPDRDTEAAETAYDHIVMTFLVDEQQPLRDELPAVSEELNRITREEIGVEVELLPLTESEIASRFLFWTNDQEEIDLAFLGNDEIRQYFGRRMLLSLDEYFYGNGMIMKALTETGPDLTEGAVYRGYTYGIGNVDDSNIYGRGFVMDREALERSGITVDPDKVYTMEEAGEIFRVLKTENDGVYPVCSMTADKGSVTENFIAPFYAASSDISTGVDYDSETGRFFNRYASAYYREFIELQRAWYLEGLLYPNLLLSDYSPKELARAGIILGYAADNSPEHLSDSGFPGGAVIINMTYTYRKTGHPGSGYWTVPVTAKNPEAAVRFLGLMYSDSRITNLLSYGIEGVHYQATDRESGLIEGVRKADGSYLYDNPYRIYGNQEQAYRRMSREVSDAWLKWKDTAEDVTDPVDGLVWESDEYTEEIEKVQEAVASYAPILESGSADIEIYYPRFIKALSDAGIDELIDARQQSVK